MADNPVTDFKPRHVLIELMPDVADAADRVARCIPWIPQAPIKRKLGTVHQNLLAAHAALVKVIDDLPGSDKPTQIELLTGSSDSNST